MASGQGSPWVANTEGSVAIEYGLILPLMLLITFGAMDAGRLLWTNIALSRATEAAARCGAVNTVTCASGSIAAYAASQALGIDDIAATNFVATAASCGTQVVATYTFQFYVPWFPSFGAKAPFGGTTLTLHATSCYPNQH
jgi:Flp pilus assembly protein TadG